MSAPLVYTGIHLTAHPINFDRMPLTHRSFLPLLLTCLLSTCVSAQTETPKLAVGIRLGSPWSLSGKFSPGDTDNALEAFIGYRRRGGILLGFGWSRVSIGALYEIHKPLEIDDFEGLQYYFGGGASALFYSYDDGLFGLDDNYSSTSFGLLAVGGLNYTFPDSPINLSIDWMPRIYLGNGYETGLGFGYGAISARYVLSR